LKILLSGDICTDEDGIEKFNKTIYYCNQSKTYSGEGIMNIAFPMQYTENFLYDKDPETVRHAARQTINKLSWSITSETDKEICACPRSQKMLTWKKDFHIDLSLDGFVQITSQCQSLDWSINRKNVKTFLNKMEELV
jgi:hypothetical protein